MIGDGEDVGVFDDQDVVWAMDTRVQAADVIDVSRNAFGAILDPSNDNGKTAKMIIDATKPRPDFAQRHTLPADAIERARALIRKVRG